MLLLNRKNRLILEKRENYSDNCQIATSAKANRPNKGMSHEAAYNRAS